MKKNLLALLLLLSTSYACSFMDVEHSYESSAPFSSYRDYHWTEEDRSKEVQESGVSQEFYELIRGKITRELASNRYSETTAEEADFLVDYHFITEERVAAAQPLTAFHHERYPPTEGMTEHPYRVGSLIMDVIDAKSQQVVWQGHVYGFMDIHKDPKKQEKRLEKAVQMLLSKFPPK